VRLLKTGGLKADGKHSRAGFNIATAYPQIVGEFGERSVREDSSERRSQCSETRVAAKFRTMST